MNDHLREPIRPETRNFDVGEFNISGLPFRIVPGKKKPGDLRLDWHTPGGWRAIKMEACFYMADFFYENEDICYPRPWQQGGEYFHKRLQRAMAYGWEMAADITRIERTFPGTHIVTDEP